MDRSILFMPVKDIVKGIRAGSVEKKAPPREKSAKQVVAGSKFAIEGRLVKGKSTDYSVGGHDMQLDHDTWVFGFLKPGAQVVVHGIYGVSGERIARKITVK